MCNVFFYIVFLVFFCIHDIYALNETIIGGRSDLQKCIEFKDSDYTVLVPSDKGVPMTICSCGKDRSFLENGAYLAFAPHMDERLMMKGLVDLELEILALKEKIVELEELKGKKEKPKVKKEELKGKKRMVKRQKTRVKRKK